MTSTIIDVRCMPYKLPIYFLKKEVTPLIVIGFFYFIIVLISMWLEAYLFWLIATFFMALVLSGASFIPAIKRARYINDVGNYFIDEQNIFVLDRSGKIIAKLFYSDKSIELSGNDIIVGASTKNQIGTFGDFSKIRKIALCNIEEVDRVYSYLISNSDK